jgi:hypothetical protein
MPIDLNPDFEDLIRSLTAHGVEFLVVGAHALAFHGIARYAGDLDLWMRRTRENADRLRLALAEFGVPITRDDAEQMTLERKFLRFGHEPRRVEILNFLDGCEYDSAAHRAEMAPLADMNVPILSLPDYVATKRASGRPKEASDLDLLREMIGRLPGDE